MGIQVLFAAVPFLLLCACASDHVDTDSADYNAGYSDGCASGSSAGSYPRSRPIRDESAFRRNPDYKAGWRTGYNACVVKTGGAGDPFDHPRDRRF
jgi:hypothetical protein